MNYLSIKGVGPTTLRKLRETFRDRLETILDFEDRGALTRVISEQKADAMLEGWRKDVTRRALVFWLRNAGLAVSLADKAVAFWGQDALAKVVEDPYRLLAIADWPEVDAAIQKLGIRVSPDRRLQAAAEAAVYVILEATGSTRASRTEILHAASAMLRSDSLAEQGLELAIENGVVMAVGGGVQSPGAHFAEQEIEQWLEERLRCAEAPASYVPAGQVGDLAPLQRIAWRNALDSPVTVFHGVDGVAMAQVLQAICGSCMAAGERVFLLAPTPAVLRSYRPLVGADAMTIPRLLANGDVPEFAHAVVLIPAFERIGLLELRNMVRRLHDTTRLVLCGDSTALSGMEQGRPVGTFTRHPSIPVVELLPDGQPPGNGEREHVLIGLRDGVVPDFPAFDWQAPQRSGILVLETSMRKIPKVVCRLLSLHPTAQVVTPLRTGMAGMSGLNAAICRRICGSANPQVGAPVVFLRNATTALGYRALEGETGVIEKVHPARPNRPLAPYLRVSSEDGPVEFTQAEWKSFVGYGHAITTGMAQGGLWDAVVAALPDCSALGRTTIRSVISGARRRCILVVESVAALSGALESKEI